MDKVRNPFFTMPISASALTCYVGPGDSKILMECPLGFDRCTRVTIRGTSTYSCSIDTSLTGGVNGTGCSTAFSIETCVCSSDGCNENEGFGNSYHISMKMNF